ncbi:MAG: aspartate/glutamate racemase family protein, partial [Candidatus Aminicenantes bacterium]|nr:aspartate/glutamate racemase family protein [Candidatus Aminicenantes bacterium]
MKRKARILLSILALFFIFTYISCTEHQSFAQQDPLSKLFRKKEVTIVVTDSGLGGLSILMDLFEKLEVSRAFQRVKLIFVNALFSNEGGYNSLNTREEKILVFDSALRSMEKRYRPDLIMIGCNTFSVLYKDTSFARQTRTPVLDIVGYGVDLISENLKSRPDAKVVIMGTQTTIEEGTHKSILIDMGFLPDRIITQACPDLVTYIEKGYDSDETEMLIFAYVDEVLQKIPRDKDSLLVSLNCTHYGYSASLWEKAFENLGVTPLAIVNPNTRMNSLFET